MNQIPRGAEHLADPFDANWDPAPDSLIFQAIDRAVQLFPSGTLLRPGKGNDNDRLNRFAAGFENEN